MPVKARDRERTVKSLAGMVTFKRNYHYCEKCEYGFYPVDRLLDLPEEGELTSEVEKRVLDFAVNDVYGECEARWRLHYGQAISENLFRRVAARVGEQSERAVRRARWETFTNAARKRARRQHFRGDHVSVVVQHHVCSGEGRFTRRDRQRAASLDTELAWRRYEHGWLGRGFTVCNRHHGWERLY